MDELTPKQLAYFKERLEALKVELDAEEKLNNQSSKPPELDQQAVGRVSRIDAIQMQQMAKAGQRRLGQKRLRLEKALQLIADGDYGFCLQCDEPIALKRLELDPTTLSCIVCAGGGEK